MEQKLFREAASLELTTAPHAEELSHPAIQSPLGRKALGSPRALQGSGVTGKFKSISGY